MFLGVEASLSLCLDCGAAYGREEFSEKPGTRSVSKGGTMEYFSAFRATCCTFVIVSAPTSIFFFSIPIAPSAFLAFAPNAKYLRLVSRLFSPLLCSEWTGFVIESAISEGPAWRAHDSRSWTSSRKAAASAATGATEQVDFIFVSSRFALDGRRRAAAMDGLASETAVPICMSGETLKFRMGI